MLDLNQLTNYLFVQQLKDFATLVQPWAVGSYAKVSPERNTLFFHSSSQKLEEVRVNLPAIAALAYLKLGCNKVDIYYSGELVTSYSYRGSTHSINMSTAVLENGVAPSLEIEVAVSSSNWVSFSAIASALGVSVESVEARIEQLSIPGHRSAGVWGLKRESAEQFLSQYYELEKQDALARMGLMGQGSAVAVAITETESVTSLTQGASQPQSSSSVPEYAGIEMALPIDYSIKGDRNRNPSPSIALKEALATLPEQNYSQYLEAIQLRKRTAMDFLNTLASQYQKPAEALQQLRGESSLLWDAYVESVAV